MIRKIDRTGEEKVNAYGDRMKIIRYAWANDIDIAFSDGTILKNKLYKHFRTGNVRNPNRPTICDIGFIGLGECNSRNSLKEFSIWMAMIKRCYNVNDSRYDAYKDCIVCSEWHNFQNFVNWYKSVYYLVDNEEMEIDKDILNKSSRVYSPETCCVVPNSINCLFIKQKSNRGKYPIGVQWNKRNHNFRTLCMINGKNEHIGCFSNPNDAFNAYKTAKEKEIKRMANLYRGKIPEFIYDALLKYEVSIDD